MKKNTLTLLVLVAFIVSSCSSLGKVGKGTLIGGLAGCLAGFAAGAEYDELMRKSTNKKDLKSTMLGSLKKKKKNNNGKVVGLAAGCAIGLGVGLYFDLMKDDIKEDLESKKIGVNEEKGSDGDINKLSLKLGEQAIKFDAGKSEIPESGKGTLDKIAESVKAYPDTKVNITGHTDGANSDSNMALSQKRADSVKEYLKTKGGLPDEQIGDSKGLGSTAPAQGLDPKDPANRRVELSITAASG